MKHAGIHFPENAGGEHPDVGTILGMPGISRGCTLICSPSARYWYANCRAFSPLTIWRAIPRVGKLPAQLGWDARKVADECLNLWDEGHQRNVGPDVEWFLPLNELQFDKELGGPFPGYASVALGLRNLRVELRRRLPGVRLMWPGWVPTDDVGQAHLWVEEAKAWDAVCLHAYGDANGMRARYVEYRQMLGPDVPIFVGEWNANHTGADERESLEMWAEIANVDAAFMGATYFIYETRNEGEHDLSIWGDDARLALFRDPPIVTAEPEPEPLPEPEEPIVTEIEAFIRDAAQKRGIDPDIAVRVAKSEGGVTQPAAHGDFETGDSWWPFQLHYGGAGYEQYGTVAGMGNGFTALTGWQPGDPAAVWDSIRYALNRAKASGWSQWYGAAHVGIGRWDGIDKDHPWDAVAEPWDYDAGAPPVPDKVTYNRNEPAIPQNDPFSCAPTSTRWALTALGRHPAESWVESTMIADGVVSVARGLEDASGRPLAAWITAQYGEYGFYANAEASVSFEALAAEFTAPNNPYPGLLGGRAWGHWSGLRGYDPVSGLLLLANPAAGWQGIHQTMNREQFSALGPFSMVRLLHPDLLAATPAPTPPAPTPAPDYRPRIRDLLAAIKANAAEIESLIGA